MAKIKTVYKCSECKQETSKWAGQCPNKQCGKWNTLDEVEMSQLFQATNTGKGIRAAKVASGNIPTPVNQVAKDTKATTRIKSGINEFDRVIGSGMVPGGIMLLAGPPGTGKSTLALWLASRIANDGKKVLYITGEETAEQVAGRAVRIGAADTKEDSKMGENLLLLSEQNLQNALQQTYDIQPDFLVVDSIQTLLSGDSESRIGSTTQATEVTTEFTNLGKKLNVPTILIGHMTKDHNTIAGANSVQHLVDVVLVFEQSNDSPLRTLRATKSRFSSTDELGCFQHAEHGLVEVADPSNLFMDEHAPGTTGYAISMTSEGRRTFPVEIQALVSPTKLPNPRKITSGFDHSRALQLQAVLEKRIGVRVFDQDVYISSVGGLKIQDPSVDLALIAALISASQDIPLSSKACFLGEVSLTGEIRAPRDRDKKIKEAARLFDIVYTTPNKNDKIENVVYVKTVTDLALAMKNMSRNTDRTKQIFPED